MRQHGTERAEVGEGARRQGPAPVGEGERRDLREVALEHVGACHRGAVASRDQSHRVEQDAFGRPRPHLADQVLGDVLGLERRQAGEQIREESLLLGPRSRAARAGQGPDALLDLHEAERGKVRRRLPPLEQALDGLAEVDRARPDLSGRLLADQTEEHGPQSLSAHRAAAAGLTEQEPHGGPDLLGLETAEEVRHLPRQVAPAARAGELFTDGGELAQRRHAAQKRRRRAGRQVSVRPRRARGCSRRGPWRGRRGAGTRAVGDGT